MRLRTLRQPGALRGKGFMGCYRCDGVGVSLVLAGDAMSEDELRKLGDDAATEPSNGDPWAKDVVRLVAEARRLRGLIKEAEWEPLGNGPGENECPWCHGINNHDNRRVHFPACPAFTVDGEVK
jgi:hypothetical protein